jgi:hypothetical protein
MDGDDWIDDKIHQAIDDYMIPLVARQLARMETRLLGELPALVEHYVHHDHLAARENLDRQHKSIAESRHLLDFVAHKQRSHRTI